MAAARERVPMEIRELETAEERRPAVPLLRQLWSDRDPEAVLAWTGDDDYYCAGGFADGDLVAVAGALVVGHLHHRRVAWLYDLVVDEPRRGEGFGAAMVDHVEVWATEQDCERVALASPLAKEGTHAFYDGLDYEPWGYIIEKDL
jgi:GNAT superfamily N-acetyltransferase